jgi:hypothetical protein
MIASAMNGMQMPFANVAMLRDDFFDDFPL